MLILATLFGLQTAAAQDIVIDPIEPDPCWPYVTPCQIEPKPNLTVTNIEVGCLGAGHAPIAWVTVENRGLAAASTWVDFWFDLVSPPRMGEHGEQWRHQTLQALESDTLTFELHAAPGTYGYIDVIVDTDDLVDEVHEDDNQRAKAVTVPDCSFS